MMRAPLGGVMNRSFDVESGAAALYSRRSILVDHGVPVAKKKSCRLKARGSGMMLTRTQKPGRPVRLILSKLTDRNLI
jgi:hypothetical protein